MHFWVVKAICLAKQSEEIGAGIFCITALTYSYVSIAQISTVICHASLAFQTELSESGGKV